jgi:hypothetical protein
MVITLAHSHHIHAEDQIRAAIRERRKLVSPSAAAGSHLEKCSSGGTTMRKSS